MYQTKLGGYVEWKAGKLKTVSKKFDDAAWVCYEKAWAERLAKVQQWWWDVYKKSNWLTRLLWIGIFGRKFLSNTPTKESFSALPWRPYEHLCEDLGVPPYIHLDECGSHWYAVSKNLPATVTVLVPAIDSAKLTNVVKDVKKEN